MWGRLESAARRWSGAKSKKAEKGILAVLKEKAPEIAQARTRKQRKREAIAWFAQEKKKSEESLADESSQKRKGCQIVQDIAEAVNNKGEVIVKIFDALHI